MIQTVVGVEGMMCSMCEAHINETLRKSFPVKSVKASRGKKQAVILSEAPLDPEAVAAAIDATGYRCTGVTAEPYEKKGLFGRRK